MGTIYFLLLVAAGLSGAFLVLRRINSKSYFFCAINEAVDHEESKAARRGTEVEHPKVAAYVDWYTRKFDNDSDSRDEIFVGAAHMINGPIAEVAVPKRQANC